MRIQKYYKKQSYNKITGPQLDLYMYEYIRQVPCSCFSDFGDSGAVVL